MKYFLISVVILLLGCSMPGVGELEERVDDLETATAFDGTDLKDRIDVVEGDVEILDERVTAIESGDALLPVSMDRVEIEEPQQPQQEEKVDLTIADIVGLQDSIDVLKTTLSDSFVMIDESYENLSLSMDSLILENDSLKIQIDDLQDQINDLSYTVDNLRYTGDTPSSSRGGGTSGSGVRSSSSSGGR